MEDAPLIDWTSAESHVLLNPRMLPEQRAALTNLAPDLPAHVWLATSGTGGALKLAGLSTKALLASAAAVNRHLDSNSADVWCCVLPTFHVGGLGIYARAFLSGARVIAMPWNAPVFAADDRITLASLVPAQVSDLVRDALRPGPRLRAVVVGGGALPEDLRRHAGALGWPLLPSYGMTECSSQIATSLPGDSELTLLDHVEARIEHDGRLALRSEALLTGYASEAGFVDPKVAGWFVTDDRVALEGRQLRVFGRTGEVIKVGGETVDLARLDGILAAIEHDAALCPIPDERLGHVIGLAVAGHNADSVAAEFNARVMPYERARKVIQVAEIPRTAIGKVVRSRLREHFR